jgi:hypothetical protein
MGDELNEQLEFEERIKAMSPDDRTIFIAKQTYALTSKVDAMDVKLDGINGGGTTKKASALSGGITAGVIVGIIEGLKAVFSK